MNIERLQDKLHIAKLFKVASLSGHRNSGNYFRTERINEFTDFMVLRTDDSVSKLDGKGKIIAFSAAYPFGEKLVRVLDSTFYGDEARAKHGGYFPTATRYFLREMTAKAVSDGRVPFFSMQSDRPHERIMSRIVSNYNKSHEGPHYKLLDGLYWTCDGEPTDNAMCWQTIAILEGSEDALALPRK